MEPFVNGMYDTELEYEIRNPNKPIHCGICGENHSPKECDILKVTNHIPDKTIPSKARLSLPDSLEIRKLSDCTYNVYTQCLIEKGTQFGPFQAKKLFTLLPSIDFPLKIFTNADEDLSEYFLDTSDENECSWMIFVGPASDFEEQNVICYQEGENLYYGTIKDILPGEPLKVWYSPYYAAKMKKALLNPNEVEENVIQEGPTDVETILKSKKNIMPRDLWSCKFCGKVEKELSAFALHLLEHYRAQLRRICTICKESFLSRRLLNKHLRFVHGNNRNKTTDSIKDAQVIVLNVKDKADSKDTSVGGPLLLNNLTADSLDNSSLLLPQTDLSHFDLSGIENQNMLLENDNLNLNVDNILNDNVKQLDHFNFEINEPETEQLICDICLRSFIKLKYLIQHIEQHTGKFLCYECNRVFARKENLVHHSCKSFYKVKCPLCVRIFFQKKYLTHHIKATHNKEFTCEKCNNFYDCKRNLETHNCPSVPIAEKEKFPCNICSKIFFKKKHLNAHIQRHTKKKPQQFICAVCNTILGSRKSYLQHARLHDGETYPCDICDKSFKRTDALKAHKELCHSEQNVLETCEICKKKVKGKSHLKVHMETHRPDKPYKCQTCQAEFKNHSNLTRHAKKHKSPRFRFESLFQDNIEVFYCPKCNKNMKLKSSLRRHIRAFHPELESTYETPKPKIGKLLGKKLSDEYSIKNDPVLDQNTAEDESVMDLKQTIENMNFNTDEVNNCSENNDINIEIDNILNNTDNLDNFLSESSDRIVESLINIAAKENQLNTVTDHYVPKEVCLSMPDLTDSDQEIKLGQNAYILDNGTIVEPQESASKVVVYILDQDKFT